MVLNKTRVDLAIGFSGSKTQNGHVGAEKKEDKGKVLWRCLHESWENVRHIL